MELYYDRLSKSIGKKTNKKKEKNYKHTKQQQTKTCTIAESFLHPYISRCVTAVLSAFASGVDGADAESMCDVSLSRVLEALMAFVKAHASAT